MEQHVIVVTTYKFDELSDKAKEKAREWFRNGYDQEVWWDSTYEDAANVADLFGLDIRQTRKTSMDKTKHWYEPTIHFSGFWSQGDGACFEGEYQYRKNSVNLVKEYAPKDTDLHDIVERLQQLQRRNFYRLQARTKHRGHYYHSGCMMVDVFGCAYSDETESELTQILREFADWIYQRLEEEYEWLMSDENVDENIRINEYDFLENGDRYI